MYKIVLENKIVSITSRCGGGLDCIPASPHGYVANRDFDFLKNLKFTNQPPFMLLFYHFFSRLSRKNSSEKT